MEKHYIVTESWVKGTKNGHFVEPLIPKNTGIVVVSSSKNKIKFYHQGHDVCEIEKDVFDLIPKVETVFDEEFIKNYIIPCENIKNLKKLFSTLKKEYKDDKKFIKIIRTLNTWIFSTKGSNAIKGKEYENLDYENLPWIKNSGFIAKPFSWWENRSGRTTVVPSDLVIKEWEETPSCVLPIGIKSSEHCTYPEIFEIGKKIFQEMCGIEGVGDNFKRIVKHFFFDIDLDYKHYDYMTGERVTLDMFEKNTHHGKTKGLELCHEDPNQIYATNFKNVRIGFSSSNRKQSGNSIEDMALNGINAMLIKRNKTVISKIQLEKILDNLDTLTL